MRRKTVPWVIPKRRVFTIGARNLLQTALQAKLPRARQKRTKFTTYHIIKAMNIDQRLESLAKSVEALKQQSADTDRRLEAGFQKTEAGFEKTQRQIDALLAVQAEHDSRLAAVTRNVDKMAQIWQETAQSVARLPYNVQDHKQRLDQIDDRLGNL